MRDDLLSVVLKIMKNKYPTASEISPSKGVDLDERYALKFFYGIDNKKAAELLEDNFTYYIDYLSYMGKSAFLYYLKSVDFYVHTLDVSKKPGDIYDAARDILRLFTERMSYNALPNKQKYSLTCEELRDSPYAVSIQRFLVDNLEVMLKDYDLLLDVDYLLPSLSKIEKLICSIRDCF